MAGFILGAMRRGLAEAGGVAEQVGIRALQSELDGMRQERLLQLQEASQARRDERQNAFASSQTDKQIAATKAEGDATRGLQRDLASDTNARITSEGRETRSLQERLANLTNDRIKDENKLNREQQLNLHKERMAQMNAQFKNMGLSLVATKDGYVVADAKNPSKSQPLLVDGKPVMPSKDYDESLKLVAALGGLARTANEAGDTAGAKQFADMALSLVQGKMPGGAGAAAADPLGLRSSMGGGNAGGGVQRAAPLVEEPPGSQPAVSDFRRRAEAERARIEDKHRRAEEMKQEYGDAGY